MNEEDIKELIEVNKEILKWVKFSILGKVKEDLESILDNDNKKIAYDMSDGEKSSRIIARTVSLTHGTISKWWQLWYKIGIAEPIAVQRGFRARKVFDLDEFGISVPEFKIPKNIEEEKEK